MSEFLYKEGFTRNRFSRLLPGVKQNNHHPDSKDDVLGVCVENEYGELEYHQIDVPPGCILHYGVSEDDRSKGIEDLVNLKPAQVEVIFSGDEPDIYVRFRNVGQIALPELDYGITCSPRTKLFSAVLFSEGYDKDGELYEVSFPLIEDKFPDYDELGRGLVKNVTKKILIAIASDKCKTCPLLHMCGPGSVGVFEMGHDDIDNTFGVV